LGGGVGGTKPGEEKKLIENSVFSIFKENKYSLKID
jgi:hypothetical protein